MTGDEPTPPGVPEVLPAGEEPQGTHSIAGRVVHQSLEYRSGPLPSAQELGEYEEVHPGFTDRILALTERETDHRIAQEAKQTDATIRLAGRGQIFAFVIVLLLVGGGIAAILTGHSVAGFSGLVLAAATLVGAFVAPSIFSRDEHPDERPAGLPPAPGGDAGETPLHEGDG